MNLLGPVFESVAAVRESFPLQRAAARMALVLVLALVASAAAAAGASGDEQGHTASIVPALIGFAGSLLGAGFAFAAAWGATRVELRRQREDNVSMRASIGRLEADVSAVREKVAHLSGVMER